MQYDELWGRVAEPGKMYLCIEGCDLYESGRQPKVYVLHARQSGVASGHQSFKNWSWANMEGQKKTLLGSLISAQSFAYKSESCSKLSWLLFT